MKSLEEFTRRVEEQNEDARRLVVPLTQEQLDWRPAAERWSIGEHLVHMAKTTRPYLAVIDEAVGEARSRGFLSAGPYRRALLGKLFERTLEPPPRMRVKTFPQLIPAMGVPKEEALADFLKSQHELLTSLRSAEGVDLGRAQVRSPFFRLLKMTAADAYAVTLAHTARHLWHLRQLTVSPDFAGRS